MRKYSPYGGDTATENLPTKKSMASNTKPNCLQCETAYGTAMVQNLTTII